MRVTRKMVDQQLIYLNCLTSKDYALSRWAPGDRHGIRNQLYSGERKAFPTADGYYISHDTTIGGYTLNTREMFFALRIANDILKREKK